MKTKSSRWQKIRNFIRCFFYPGFVVIIVMILADASSEIFGLPQFIENILARKLREIGYEVSFTNAKAGLINGIIIENPRMFESSIPDTPFLSADAIKINLEFTPYNMRFKVTGAEISNGRFAIPLFPEDPSILNETLSLENMNARAILDNGSISMAYANCRFKDCLFSFSGRIKNAFLADRNNRSLEKDRGEQQFSPSAIMKRIKLEKRKLFLEKLQFLEKIPLKSRLYTTINALFDFDAVAPELSDVKGKAHIPDLFFSPFDFTDITLDFHLQNEHVFISNGSAALKEGKGKFEISNLKFQIPENVLSAKITGKIKAEFLDNFLNDEKYIDIKSGEEINISVEIRKADFTKGNFEANFDAGFPELQIEGTIFSQSSISLGVKRSSEDPKKILIEKAIIDLEKNGKIEINGSVNLENYDFSVQTRAEIRAPKETPFFEEFLSAFSVSVIPAETAFSLNAQLDGSLKNLPSSLSGDILFELRKITLDKQIINFCGAKLQFKNELLQFDDLKILLDEDKTIEGRLFYSPKEGTSLVSLSTLGNPSFIIPFLDKKTRATTSDFFSKFKFSADKEYCQSNIKMYFQKDEKKQDSYFIDGNIAAKYFDYNGISFDSGICRFTISSDGTIIVPNATLFKGNNSVVMSILYDNRENQQQNIINSSLKETGQEKLPRDILFFKLISNINGNDLFKCMLSDTKPEWLDFSSGCPVEISGKIDYLNDDNTTFLGQVKNTDILAWNKLKFKKISSVLNYHDQTLFIPDFNGILFNGACNLAFKYAFPQKKGSLKISLKDADINKLMKGLNPEDKTEIGGLISFQADSELIMNTINGINSPLLNGNGTLSLRGCDIMSIPFLGGLLDILWEKNVKKDWVKITALNADFKLDKTKIQSDSIQTNGEFLAFSAYGYYDWEKDFCDVNVRIKPLQEILSIKILSIITNPLFSIIEAKYYGSGKKKKWIPSSGIINGF